MKKIIIFLAVLLSLIQSFSQDVDFKMIPQDVNTGHVHKIVFNRDGSLFASVNMTSALIKIWSIKGKLLKILFNDSPVNICEMSFSSDNKYLAVSDYTKIVIWDIETGDKTIIKNNEESMPYRNFTTVVFSEDGKSVLAGIKLNVNLSLPLFFDKKEFENDLLKKVNKKDEELFKNAYFLNNEKVYELRMDLLSYSELFNAYLACGKKVEYRSTPAFKNRIEIWGIDGKFIRAFGDHNNDMMTEIKYIINNTKAQNILSYGTDGIIKIWDKNGNFLNKLSGDNPYYLSNIDFSEDGKFIAWAGSSGYKIMNINGIIVATNKRTLIMPDIKLDKKFYIEVGSKGTNESFQFLLRVRDLSDKILVESEVIPHSLYTKISPDATHAVAGSLDGSVKIINLINGRVVTLINNNDSEWLSYTEDGYWDASPHGDKLISMVKDMEAYSADQFAVKFNRPDIILERLGFRNEAEINFFKNLYLTRLKKLGLKEESLLTDLHTPSVKIVKTKSSDKFFNLTAELNDTKFNLKKYNIFVNETPLYKYGKNINGKNAVINEEIELVAGDNKIEVTCMNEKGAESFRTVTFASYNQGEKKGSLYFIGFGVSKYKNQQLNLKYADKDAKDIEGVLRKIKGYYGKIVTKVYTNEEVTSENIRAAKNILKDAGVDDTLVLFIAGHGVHDVDPDATYYFLTYNAELKDLKNTACAFEFIEDILHDIKPREKLFLMDTCESGELDIETENNYINTALASNFKPRTVRGLKKVAGDKKSGGREYIFDKDRFIYNNLTRRSGAIVFSSSKGYEFSYEKDEYENGLFTEELINSMTKNNSDMDNDGFVSVDELKNFVSKEVSEKSGHLQHPTIDRDNKFQKIKIPLSR